MRCLQAIVADPSESKSKSKSKSIPVLQGTRPSQHRSNYAAAFAHRHNNTVARPGSPCPNPIPFRSLRYRYRYRLRPRPRSCFAVTFLDERHRDRARLAGWGGQVENAATFSDGFELEPVRARPFRRRLQAMVADPSDHCLNQGRGRNRDRNRFLSWLAPDPHGPLKLRCRVVSAPQQYGCGTRF